MVLKHANGCIHGILASQDKLYAITTSTVKLWVSEPPIIWSNEQSISDCNSHIICFRAVCMTLLCLLCLLCIFVCSIRVDLDIVVTLNVSSHLYRNIDGLHNSNSWAGMDSVSCVGVKWQQCKWTFILCLCFFFQNAFSRTLDKQPSNTYFCW